MLFCYVLPIFASTSLVCMALFCAGIIRDSVLLSRFSFLAMPTSGVRFRHFVAWNIHIVVFPPISVFSLLFSGLLSFLCCFWSFKSEFLCSFLCSRRVIVSMHRCYLQYWRVILFILFLTHTICLWHLSDVTPYASSLFFLFFCPFVEILLSSISRVVPSILWGGTAQVFIPLIKFPLLSLISRSFLIRMR